MLENSISEKIFGNNKKKRVFEHKPPSHSKKTEIWMNCQSTNLEGYSKMSTIETVVGYH